MKRASLAPIGAALLLVVLPRLAVADDETALPSTWSAELRRPRQPAFDLELLVDGRPLATHHIDARSLVYAVPGANYELRVTNPLPVRVAVTLSVDGLNTVDARRTDAWDASKWLIHPYQTLTVSGWQVSTERAHRFYFTTERDSYAERLGHRADFGVVKAVFFRERPSPLAITPRTAEPFTAGREVPRGATPLVSSLQAESGSSQHDEDHRFLYQRGRAATGRGRPTHSEVDVVDMLLERLPVAEVEIRYDYRPAGDPPEAPRLGPEPHRAPRGGPIEDRRFCPDEAGVENSKDR
jgi:hypothetical protein